jgi:long-chain fatty acid transport protein
LAATFSSVALGQGFAYPDNGAEALGRAGSFAAKADDGTAIYYNPAGLADQDGLRVLLDTNLVNNSITFQRMDFSGSSSTATGTNVGPPVSNSGGMFLGPFGTVSYQIIKHLTVAIGAYGPPADGTLTFPGETPPVYNQNNPGNVAALLTGQPSAGAYTTPAEAGPGNDPQKYNLISNNIFIVYPTLALAYAPIKYVSLGISAQMVYANTQINEATFDGASVELGAGPHSENNEVPVWDTIANIKVGNQIGGKYAGVFGVLLKPIDMIRIGASYRPGFRIDQSGTMTLNYSTLEQAGGATMQGGNTGNTPSGCNATASSPACTSGTGPATFSLPMPGDFKSGVDVDFGKGRDVELDFDYMQWSQVQQLVLVPDFSVKTSEGVTPVAQVNIPEHFQDTWSLRLGGGYKIPIPGPIRLSVRAGLAYTSSVYNTAAQVIYPSLSFANFDEYTGALGVTAGYKWIDLTLGYSHVYEPTVSVSNSGTTMTENFPASTPASTFKNYAPVVVGNGTYASAYDILAVGIGLKFF